MIKDSTVCSEERKYIYYRSSVPFTRMNIVNSNWIVRKRHISHTPHKKRFLKSINAELQSSVLFFFFFWKYKTETLTISFEISVITYIYIYMYVDTSRKYLNCTSSIFIRWFLIAIVICFHFSKSQQTIHWIKAIFFQ